MYAHIHAQMGQNLLNGYISVMWDDWLAFIPMSPFLYYHKAQLDTASVDVPEKIA